MAGRPENGDAANSWSIERLYCINEEQIKLSMKKLTPQLVSVGPLSTPCGRRYREGWLHAVRRSSSPEGQLSDQIIKAPTGYSRTTRRYPFVDFSPATREWVTALKIRFFDFLFSIFPHHINTNNIHITIIINNGWQDSKEEKFLSGHHDQPRTVRCVTWKYHSFNFMAIFTIWIIFPRHIPDIVFGGKGKWFQIIKNDVLQRLLHLLE